MSAAPFLAADIGGTHARMALARTRDDGTVELLDQHRYLCAEHPSLESIVSDFLSTRGKVDDAVIGVAGVVRGEQVISRNVPWPVTLSRLRALGIVRAAAVNDFVAVAHAEQCMNEVDTVPLTPWREHAIGPTLVVGPGTGLGAALRVPVGERTLVLPSEPQQIAFAPGNARELAVLQHWMRGGAGHVGVGQAVSGPGLLNLYRALCEIDGIAPRLQTPAQVADALYDAHAVEAVACFCSLFGSVVGDLVMIAGATRVFVAGGVPLRIKPQLLASDFAARFADKDVMRPVLQQVPVRLVEDPDMGLIGAAAWYLQRR